MKTKLEHVNMTVSDSKAAAEALCALFDWRIRWHGPAKNDGYTYHVGTDDSYIAVYSPPKGVQRRRDDPAAAGYLNHIGVVVEDLDAIEARVIADGYTPHNHADYEPGRRFYFDGIDEIEIEVVSYSQSA